MILQYKGFNNNWCYEEANRIMYANVYVGKETRDYRKGGIRYELYQKDLDKCKDSSGVIDEDMEFKTRLSYTKEMLNAVNKLIMEEVHCGDNIVYMIEGTKFDNMENVCVVTLHDKNKGIAYVFDKGVYILNNSGGTVLKIA